MQHWGDGPNNQAIAPAAFNTAAGVSAIAYRHRPGERPDRQEATTRRQESNPSASREKRNQSVNAATTVEEKCRFPEWVPSPMGADPF